MNRHSDRSFAQKAQQRCAVITLLIIVTVMPSCGFQESKKSAEQAVLTFRSQMDSERYEEIYTQADDEFRKSQSEAEMVSFLEAVHRKLGKVVASGPTGFGVNTALGSGRSVVLSYETTFEGGKGTEQFVWHMTGGRTLLFQYHLSSMELVTDDDKKAAQQAAAQFHALYNDEQYSQMYAQSHQLLRCVAPESVFIKAMKDNREGEFGRMEEVIESKEKVVFGAPGAAVQVRIGYHTKYEKGEATEYFTWMMGGDKPEFALYKIFHGSLPLDDPGPSPSQTPTRQKF